MPPCSAIERMRFDTRHSVDHDSTHTTYIRGRITAIDTPSMTTCTAKMYCASCAPLRTALKRLRKFL